MNRMVSKVVGSATAIEGSSKQGTHVDAEAGGATYSGMKTVDVDGGQTQTGIRTEVCATFSLFPLFLLLGVILLAKYSS